MPRIMTNDSDLRAETVAKLGKHKLWVGHHTFRVAHGAYVQHSGWPQVLCINYAILSVSGLDGCVICGRACRTRVARNGPQLM